MPQQDWPEGLGVVPPALDRAEGAQRLCLTTGAVEGDHQMPGERLPERMLVDETLEAIVGDLEQRGLWSQTLLVIASDHGEEFMEHGGLGHGRHLEREQLRAPLIFAGATGVSPVRVAASVKV